MSDALVVSQYHIKCGDGVRVLEKQLKVQDLELGKIEFCNLSDGSVEC